MNHLGLTPDHRRAGSSRSPLLELGSARVESCDEPRCRPGLSRRLYPDSGAPDRCCAKVEGNSRETRMSKELVSTAVLVERYRQGDERACDELLHRYLPMLRRWAHGRLPAYARSTAETDDLVQVTLQRALRQLGRFEVRHEGAFLAYLRRIFLNTVRDEIRRYGRSPRQVDVEAQPHLADGEPSAIERLLGQQKLERYELALAALPEEHRHAVILRVEFGMSFEEIAKALDRPSANAARMTVTRALDKLAEQLGD